MHGTASPAEVFHRNLVDAVSNVEGKSITRTDNIVKLDTHYVRF